MEFISPDQTVPTSVCWYMWHVNRLCAQNVTELKKRPPVVWYKVEHIIDNAVITSTIILPHNVSKLLPTFGTLGSYFAFQGHPRSCILLLIESW